MPEKPYMPFYYGAWRQEIQLMLCSLAAQAVWLHICGIVWDTKGVLEITEDELVSLVKNDVSPADQVRKCLQELEQRKIFSRDKKGRIYCRRIVSDIQKQELKAAAGKIGGKKTSKNYQKLLKQQQFISAQAEKENFAQAEEREKNQANSRLDYLSISSNSSFSEEGTGETLPTATPAKTKKTRPSALEGFDEFYAEYPKRVAAGAAEKAWAKATTGKGAATPEEIMTGLRAQIAARVFPDDRQFIPNPATWLNARRWRDDLTTLRAKPQFAFVKDTTPEMKPFEIEEN